MLRGYRSADFSIKGSSSTIILFWANNTFYSDLLLKKINFLKVKCVYLNISVCLVVMFKFVKLRLTSSNLF